MYLRARKYDLFTARQTSERVADSDPRLFALKSRIQPIARCEHHSGPMNRWIERLR